MNTFCVSGFLFGVGMTIVTILALALWSANKDDED
jgi:hypothetical protein